MAPDLVCFSHLRWDFVYQRPNHLMARAARDRRVFFVEEAVPGDGRPSLELLAREELTVVRPHLPGDRSAEGRRLALESLMVDLVEREEIVRPWLWYYTPMALPWTDVLGASAVVYDCMDELSAFRGASPELTRLEAQLLRRADVVFTGGHALWEAKADRHDRVVAMPSSVDTVHFGSARTIVADPADQAAIGRPRIGYYGVIDERLDRELIAGVAAARPDWQLVLVGPVAKLTPDEVPSGPNIHHLGMKAYADLPAYLAGWDVAMMPFAINEATRYISPTKTPEYLAGGRPVISTAIRDVVQPYGHLELVSIASDVDGWVRAIEGLLAESPEHRAERQRRADQVLAAMSWDRTFARMDAHVREAIALRRPAPAFSAARRGAPATSDVALDVASRGA